MSSANNASSRARTIGLGSRRTARSKASTAASGMLRGDNGSAGTSVIVRVGSSVRMPVKTAHAATRRSEVRARLMVLGFAPSCC